MAERSGERVAGCRKGARIGAAALRANLTVYVGGAFGGKAGPGTGEVLIDKKPDIVRFMRAETALKLIHVLGAARFDAQPQVGKYGRGIALVVAQKPVVRDFELPAYRREIVVGGGLVLFSAGAQNEQGEKKLLHAKEVVTLSGRGHCAMPPGALKGREDDVLRFYCAGAAGSGRAKVQRAGRKFDNIIRFGRGLAGRRNEQLGLVGAEIPGEALGLRVRRVARGGAFVGQQRFIGVEPEEAVPQASRKSGEIVGGRRRAAAGSSGSSLGR